MIARKNYLMIWFSLLDFDLCIVDKKLERNFIERLQIVLWGG